LVNLSCISVAVFLWNVAPWRARFQPPKNAVDDIAVVRGRTDASPALAGRSFEEREFHNPTIPFRLNHHD